MNRIFDLDNWREIGATLSRNKTRTFLTGFGIFWGVAMLVLLLGGAGGVKGLVEKRFDGFATNMALLFPGQRTMSYKGYNAGSSFALNERDVKAILASQAPIDAFSLNFGVNTAVTYGSKSTSATLNGVNADYFRINTPNILAGRVLNSRDDITEAKVGVIGAQLASSLFGSEDPIGKYIKTGTINIRIVGVISSRNDININGSTNESVYVPYTVLKRAYNMGNDIYAMLFTWPAGKTLDDARPYINRAIRANHPFHPDDNGAIQFWDVSQQFAMIQGVFVAIAILAAFVGLGTLLAGAIGLGNIMWIIVKERTQEIGIRRAIGARPRDIIMQVLSEAAVLTVVAGLAGISFATGVLYLAEKMFSAGGGTAGFELTLMQVLGIMVIFLILGLLAGSIPAIKAMRIKPVEAINDK